MTDQANDANVRAATSRWRAALAALCIAGLTSGAAAQLSPVPRSETFVATAEASGGSPTFTQANDFNPFRPTGDRRASITHVLEGLFYYSALNDKTIPWLATDFNYNPDYTSITLNLRQGVTWSDKTPFTADDVIYTLTMLQQNGKGKADSLFAADMARDIKGIERLGDHKLRIDLTRSDPRWAFTFLVIRFNRQGIHIVPKHIYSAFDPNDLQAFTGLDPQKPGWPVGTGAFRVAEMKPERIVLDRRDDWWGTTTGFRDAPAMKRVIFVPFTTHEAAAQLIANDEVDTILEAQVPVMKGLIARYEKITTSSGRKPPYGNIDWWPTALVFNHDDPQWKDLRIRRAVSLYLNRKQLVDFAYQGAAAISTMPYPRYPALVPFITDMDPEVARLRTNEFDPKAADALMKEAGAAKDGQGFWARDGKRLGGDLYFTASLNAIAPAIAEQLRRAGFEVAATSRPGHRDVICGRRLGRQAGHRGRRAARGGPRSGRRGPLPARTLRRHEAARLHRDRHAAEALADRGRRADERARRRDAAPGHGDARAPAGRAGLGPDPDRARHGPDGAVRPSHPYTRLLVGSIPWPDLDRPWGDGQPILKDTGGAAAQAGCVFTGRCPDAMPVCREGMPQLRKGRPDIVARCRLYDQADTFATGGLGGLLSLEPSRADPASASPNS